MEPPYLSSVMHALGRALINIYYTILCLLRPEIKKSLKKQLTNTLRGYMIKIPAGGIASEVNGMEEMCTCCKTTDRSAEQQKKLINRLSRIEGQIRGIKGMIEKDAYCTDVLTQSAAVTAAMQAFSRELLSDHLHSCVIRDIREGKDDVVDELVGILQKLMR